MAIRGQDVIGVLEVIDGRAALMISVAQDSRFGFLPANIFTYRTAVLLWFVWSGRVRILALNPAT